MAKKPKPTADFVLKQLKEITPFQSRDELLLKLASCWNRRVGVKAAVISVWDHNEKFVCSSIATSTEESFVDRHSIAGEFVANKRRVLNHLRGLPDLVDFKVAKNRLLPKFKNAAIFLFGDKLIPWTEKENQLLELSALLLKQAELESGEESPGFAEKLLQAKLEAMAELAAGAGHEVNNPLGTITGRVQLLLKNETDPEKRRALLTIGSQANRARDMIGDLMLFGRPPVPAFESCDLSDLVRKVAKKVESRREEKNFQLSLTLEDSVPLTADSVQLEIVIHELIRNSIEAIEERGTISIETVVETINEEQFAVLNVRDHGQGLDEIEREHLFDPFFSGRQSGRGLGFGLSKCWRIVSNHQGKIAVQSEPGSETVFTVHWPIIQRSDSSCDT